MLTVLWSTPRTGSTSYCQYLFDNLHTVNRHTVSFRQFLNEFNMKSYVKNQASDLIYHYEIGARYEEFYIDPLGKKLSHKLVFDKRWRNLHQEEDYRISLLEKHNYKKYPMLLHQHVSPMTIKSYSYLRSKASRNIFLYRRNFIDQLSSYALSMHTSIFVKRGANHVIPILQDVTVDKQLLSNLSNRIKEFYLHDKTGCEIVYYEDIDFSKIKDTEKQNKVKPFDQLSVQTQLDILELNEDFEKFKLVQKIA